MTSRRYPIAVRVVLIAGAAAATWSLLIAAVCLVVWENT